jgi:hypothetical protein
MSKKQLLPVTVFFGHRGAASIIVRGNDQVSFVPFKNTNTVHFLFPGLECKKEAVGMLQADIFKSAF